jgi:hypothetical protein
VETEATEAARAAAAETAAKAAGWETEEAKEEEKEVGEAREARAAATLRDDSHTTHDVCQCQWSGHYWECGALGRQRSFLNPNG